MRVKHKKFLRRNIIMVFSLLVGALLTVFIYGVAVLDDYRMQVEKNVLEIIDFYSSDINSDFDKINTQLLNLLLGNGIIQKELIAMEDISSEQGKVRLINAQNDLNQMLYDVTMNYGDGYNLWFYSGQLDIYCESGNGDYVHKNDFRDYIVAMYRTEQVPLTQQQKWNLVDTGNAVYAVSVYRLGSDYIGCWINVLDLLKPLMGLDMIGQGGIYVNGTKYGVSQVYHADKNGAEDVELKSIEEPVLSMLNLKYADFYISVIGVDYMQTQVLLYQIIMAVLGISSVIFMVWMVHFIKSAVIQPLLFF